MNKKNFLMLAGLLITTLACNALSKAVENEILSTSVPSNPEPGVLSTPAPSDLEPGIQKDATAPNDTNSPCQAEQWTFQPVAIYRYPQGNGVDLVIVDLAIHNGSKYWGYIFSIPTDRVFITTEGGYTYVPFSGWVEGIPDNPKSPYSGTTYYQNAFIKPPTIPPGFTSVGLYDPYNKRTAYYTFGFEIASSQKSPVFHIKDSSLTVFCENPEAQYGNENLPGYSFPLDKLVDYALPTAENNPDLGSEPIIVPGLGTFVYKGLTQQEGVYVLQFSFTNENGGFSTSGNIFGYLVGNDGIFNSPNADETSFEYDYGQFEAGPAQTVDVAPLPFKIPAGLENLKFVFEDKDNHVYKVYNLVP